MAQAPEQRGAKQDTRANTAFTTQRKNALLSGRTKATQEFKSTFFPTFPFKATATLQVLIIALYGVISITNWIKGFSECELLSFEEWHVDYLHILILTHKEICTQMIHP